SFGRKDCITRGCFIAYPYQITGIYGESGTGKSSLLYVLGMLLDSNCEYSYNNDILTLNNTQKEEFRNKHISFITQNSLLIETISVEKNIEFYLSQSESSYDVIQLLEMIHMEEKKNALPNSLSGGERQRIAIACALAKNSDIILGDELTSALDEDNKAIIMNLLKECAKQGKTVILVSHEKKVIEQCDRLYKIDHCELILEKEFPHNIKECKHNDCENKQKVLDTFEILFHSNKKMNIRRIINSFIVMAILFLSVSMFIQSYKASHDNEFSVEDVSNRKILAMSDENYHLKEDKFGIAIRSIVEEYPILEYNIAELNKVNNIDKIYDYYIFRNGTFRTGGNQKMSLVAKRDNKEIEKRKSTSDEPIDKHDFEFSVVPFYPEETTLKQNQGIYVDKKIAHLYQLEVGDELELELVVPFAMSKYEVESEEEGKPNWYNVSTINEQVSYKSKVAGIIEPNSNQGEIYMQYSEMQRLIDEQVQKYKSGKLVVYKDSFYGEVFDLQPYAKMVFVDKYENVLKVQNDISEVSDKIFVYSEYQSVLKLMEESAEIAMDSFKIACFGIAIFVIGAVIVELLYLKKYQSTYMMLRLIGYHHKSKRKIFLVHALWQILNILCLSTIIYLTASIPQIMMSLNMGDFGQIMGSLPDMYFVYSVYGQFSLMHLGIFISLVIVVVGVVNILMNRHYEKSDIIKWMRGNNI
ncbi:MAG: ATP-binding cassette domain-containing protein, partial [Coprobacillus sp.]